MTAAGSVAVRFIAWLLACHGVALRARRAQPARRRTKSSRTFACRPASSSRSTPTSTRLRARWRLGQNGTSVRRHAQRQGLRGQRQARLRQQRRTSHVIARQAQSCRTASRFATARCTSPRSIASLRYDAIESSLDNVAGAESRARRFAEGSASRLEVHCLRSRRQAVRADRRALQRLQRAEATASITRMNAGWLGPRGVRARRSQHRRLHLASANAGAVVHGQWTRLARRRSAPPCELNVAPRARTRFRISVLSRPDIKDPDFGTARRMQPR